LVIDVFVRNKFIKVYERDENAYKKVSKLYTYKRWLNFIIYVKIFLYLSYIANEIKPVKLNTPNKIPIAILNTNLNQKILSNFSSLEESSWILSK
jgi:hypothetical protein